MSEEPQIRVISAGSLAEALEQLFGEIRGGECPILGSGKCCHDVHYDTKDLPDAARAALPHNHEHLCGEDMGKSAGLSTVPDEVTCTPCRERLFA